MDNMHQKYIQALDGLVFHPSESCTIKNMLRVFPYFSAHELSGFLANCRVNFDIGGPVLPAPPLFVSDMVHSMIIFYHDDEARRNLAEGCVGTSDRELEYNRRAMEYAQQYWGDRMKETSELVHKNFDSDILRFDLFDTSKKAEEHPGIGSGGRSVYIAESCGSIFVVLKRPLSRILQEQDPLSALDRETVYVTRHPFEMTELGLVEHYVRMNDLVTDEPLTPARVREKTGAEFIDSNFRRPSMDGRGHKYYYPEDSVNTDPSIGRCQQHTIHTWSLSTPRAVLQHIAKSVMDAAF